MLSADRKCLTTFSVLVKVSAYRFIALIFSQQTCLYGSVDSIRLIYAMTGMVRSPLVDFIELLKQNFVLYYLVLHRTIDSFHIALPVDCIVLSVCESV